MMPARELSPGVSLDWLLEGLIPAPDLPPVEVLGLRIDSRGVCPGDLFFALAGTREHGLRFAEGAIRAGAAAIVYDPAGGGTELANRISELVCLPLPDLAQKLGAIADRYYGEPSRGLEVIAITGTNGKTSCSHFLAHACQTRRPAAVIGTLGWGQPGGLTATSLTTPDAVEMHGILARLKSRGVGLVAMEASSVGLDQGRVNGIRFRGALFTNFSRDHLDYHGSMEAYLEAKLRLPAWPGLEFLALNLDDDSAPAVIAATPAKVRKIGFTLKTQARVADTVEVISGSDVRQHAQGISFTAHHQGRSAMVRAPVYGQFNAENLLACLAVLLGRGFLLQEAAERLADVRPVPGRMERFCRDGGPIAVVDYAHTPDALEKALTSLRSHISGKLWVVFGCGGDRDRGKRPEMGAIAARLADRIILTDDNPRSEDGAAIIAEIRAACDTGSVQILRDRGAAIALALSQSRYGDAVLIAGKGHETYQDIGGIKYPFSDRELVAELTRGRSS
jgi:UDP-N-acetylmuramoyl-L-alanyl-D-glutamate--2,6-diaminopimelate ligase